MQKTFYLVRHGETLANSQGTAAGVFDTPLTEKGRQQAQILENQIFQSGIKFDYIVHSGLSRTRDTASILNARLNLPMLENKKLMEQDFGEWRGRNWDEIIKRIRAGDTPPGGESMAQFYARALQGINEAIHAMPGTLLLVAHGGVLNAFLDHYKLDQLDVHNCALCRLSLQETNGTIIGSAQQLQLNPDKQA